MALKKHNLQLCPSLECRGTKYFKTIGRKPIRRCSWKIIILLLIIIPFVFFVFTDGKFGKLINSWTYDEKRSTNWTPWSLCSRTCGVGWKVRYGANEKGESQEFRSCTVQKCTQRDLANNIGPWLSWSVCSVTCGEGKQTRNRWFSDRKDEKSPVSNYETRSCSNEKPCPVIKPSLAPLTQVQQTMQPQSQPSQNLNQNKGQLETEHPNDPPKDMPHNAIQITGQPLLLSSKVSAPTESQNKQPSIQQVSTQVQISDQKSVNIKDVHTKAKTNAKETSQPQTFSQRIQSTHPPT